MRKQQNPDYSVPIARAELAPLPYAKNALAPHIGEQTVELHYEKHHRGYLNKLKKAVADKPEAQQGLLDVIRTQEGKVFNLAAQVFNHDFYWRSLDPDGGGQPSGDLASRIDRDFGSFDEFASRFLEVAKGHFGSGWAWLVAANDGRLRIVDTHDADNPLTRSQTPLLTVDVWEHAYYLDRQNDRGRYLQEVLEHLLDWDFAARNLKEAAQRS